MAYAGAAQGTDAGQTSGAAIPDVPKNTLQYYKTDINACEMEHIKAGETNVLPYKNATLVMTCDRNCELNVTVNPTVTPKTFGLYRP